MKKRKTDELAFTLRVYREGVAKLDYIAGTHDRSRNSEINQAIRQYIAAYEKENGKITKEDLEALEGTGE